MLKIAVRSFTVFAMLTSLVGCLSLAVGDNSRGHDRAECTRCGKDFHDQLCQECQTALWSDKCPECAKLGSGHMCVECQQKAAK